LSTIRFQQDFGGIQRVEVPPSFPSGSANIYLVPQKDGWILMDCGMNLQHLLPIYESGAIAWSTIRQIVFTHFQPDYADLKSEIQQLTGGAVRMPFRTDDLLNRLRATVHCLSWQDRLLHWAGLLDPVRGCVRTAYPPSPPLVAGSYIEDGEIIPTALGSMQALLTPGHSSGQLCFYFAKRKLLLAGDQLSRPCADGRALADFRASLRKLQILNVDWVLPSHGRPCSASEYRIASFLDGRREMASRVGCLRARGNESARELVARTSCVGLARRLSACATD